MSKYVIFLENRMKKLLFIILLMLALVFVLASCDKNYEVSFDSNGGSEVASQTVKDGEPAEAPSEPKKKGYDFGGWYLGDVMWDFANPVTENITLTAKWTPKTYIITYQNLPSDKYSVFNQTDTQEYTVEDTVTLYTPSNVGPYSFVGWYTDEELTIPFTESLNKKCQDVTLYAKWVNEGIEIVNNSGISAIYYCTLDTNKYTYQIAFNIDAKSSFECDFELLKPDGNAYTRAEIENLGITYKIVSNSFYLVAHNSIKGFLKINKISVKVNIFDLPVIAWPE